MATTKLNAISNSIATWIIRHSFIDKIMPFVRSNSLVEIPSVGVKIPLRYTSGFTLVELIVTLAVVAVLVAIATPTMRTTIQNNRIVTLTNDLMSDINLARTEAIKRTKDTQTTGLCMSTSGAACDGASWQGGRIVFATDAGVFSVLRAREALSNNTLTTLTVPNPLMFNRRGFPTGIAAGAGFSLCDERGTTQGRFIRISPTGQVSSTTNPASC